MNKNKQKTPNKQVRPISINFTDALKSVISTQFNFLTQFTFNYFFQVKFKKRALVKKMIKMQQFYAQK